MDSDLVARLFVEGVQLLVKSLDIIVQARPSNASNRHYADSILVAHRHRLLRVKRWAFERQRHLAHLYAPKLCKLLPHNLIGGTQYDIWLFARLTLLLAASLPTQECRHASEHTRLRGADTYGTRLPLRLLGGVPKVGDNVDTATTHHRHARVLRLVYIVDIHRLVHQLCSVVVHIGRNESCKVEAWLCLRISLVLDHLIRHFGRGWRLRYKLGRSRRKATIGSSCAVGCALVFGCCFSCFHSTIFKVLVTPNTSHKPYQKKNSDREGSLCFGC